MNQRVLNALLIAVSFTQIVPAALAADSGKVLLADSTTGTGIDMTLHRSSRWQLPSCGALKAPEAPKSAKGEVEEEFPTPASVEAAEKKAALAKKTGRAAATTAAAQPAASVNAVAVTSPSAVKVVAPAAVAAPANRSASSQEGTIMRLTITPGEQEKEEPAPSQVRPRRVMPTTTASAPLPGRNDSVSRMPASPPSAASKPPAPNSNQMPAFAPPSRNGAPVPGGGVPENPALRNPGKTAAKGNNQA